jgi:FMN phosphatase YigB (HAD superfamily)
MSRYFGALTEHSQPLYEGDGLVDVLLGATRAMWEDHPERTNRDVFHEAFLDLSGVDLDEHWELFEDFYENRFDDLGDGMGPKPGARKAVETALELGLKTVVATNPMFPRTAIEKRLGWAGVRDMDYDLVTTYEIMHACKPHPAYYLEIAEMLAVAPEECLMVGDDPQLDLPAREVGMATYYVGDAAGIEADMQGDLEELSELLPTLATSGV